jgi:thymidylate synthase ThyX
VAYSAKIVLDSKCSETGARLTTWELTYPRMVHAEFMTHRQFSRNAASSRAIPIQKMIEWVLEDPVLPVWWGKNQSGMQALEEIDGKDREAARELILHMRDKTVDSVKRLQQFGLHKQIANRYLEPWMWITVICSATNFANWFHLRTDVDAQPEIKKIADMMCEQYYYVPPTLVPSGWWHMPYIQPGENEILRDGEHYLDRLKRISAARCARISYLTHDGKRDQQADLDLFDRLVKRAQDSNKPGHWSPLEHVARAQHPQVCWSGNFHGWTQYRKSFAEECTTSFNPKTREVSA